MLRVRGPCPVRKYEHSELAVNTRRKDTYVVDEESGMGGKRYARRVVKNNL